MCIRDSRRAVAVVEYGHEGFSIQHPGKGIALGGQLELLHLAPAPVSYTHLDVYKRQILEGAVERMRDWGSFLQHCQLLALVLGADERAGGGQAADTVAVGVGKLQRFRRDDRCNEMCIRDSPNTGRRLPVPSSVSLCKFYL